MVQILKQCGNDLTRENVMKQAANLKNFKLPLLLPGMALNTGPTDFFPVQQAQLQKFTGTQWQLFGELIEHRRALARPPRPGAGAAGAGPCHEAVARKRPRLMG